MQKLADGYEAISSSVMMLTPTILSDAKIHSEINSIRLLEELTVEPCLYYISAAMGIQFGVFCLAVGLLQTFGANFGIFSISWTIQFAGMAIICALWRILITDSYKEYYTMRNSLKVTTMCHDCLQFIYCLVVIAMFNWQYYLISMYISLGMVTINGMMPTFWYAYARTSMRTYRK